MPDDWHEHDDVAVAFVVIIVLFLAVLFVFLLRLALVEGEHRQLLSDLKGSKPLEALCRGGRSTP